MKDRERILELKEILRHHAVLYYDLDNPEISDTEYDDLEKEYKELTGKHFEYMGTPNSLFNEVRHTTSVKSLEKINNISEVKQYLLKLAPGIIQPKYDGLTLVIYPSGVIATRGDGEVGEDVTHTAGKFLLSPVRKGERLQYPVRGEAFLSISEFDRINQDRVKRGKEPYKNLRNAISGMIRNKDHEEVDPSARFVAYNLLGTTLSESEQLDILSEFYETPSKYSFKFTKNDIEKAVEFIQNFDREGIDFEIDGLVIKSDIRNSIEIFGSTSHHFKNAVAYKFPAQGKWTRLKDVVWTVGRTGKVVPNAVIEPIELLNTTVSKSTLHNASYLKRLGLTKDCEVYVVKSNDIIPGVIKARHKEGAYKYEEITHCPSCGSKLDKVNSEDTEGVYQLYCQNPVCGSRSVERLVHMAKKECLDIEGLSVKTAEKLFENVINEPWEIFELGITDFEYYIPGFGRKSAENLYNNIQKAKEVPLSKFLSSVGIPLVGKNKAEDIANRFKTYEALINDIKVKGGAGLNNIGGIGDAVIESILKNYTLWENLRKYVTPLPHKEIKFVEKQLTFVITGSFSDGNGIKVSRKTIEQKIKEAGHKVTGSVSRNTDYIVVGDKPGSKVTKADDLGITKIFSLSELSKIIL